MNRLNEIHLNSDIYDWKFSPGNLNPADLCTKYTPFSQLMTQKLWFNSSEYTDEEAIESIFDLENIDQVDNLKDSKSINTAFKRKKNVKTFF